MKKLFGRLTFLFILLVMSIAFAIVYQDSQRVLSYRSLVKEVLTNREISIDEELVLAMIYTESKGKGQDILQASESLTGQIGQISSPKASLEVGIDLFEQNLSLSSQKQTDSWTAVQAYNMGTTYIDYVAENGGKSTIYLARTFSQEVVAPSLGNTNGDTYAYYHPLAIMYGQPSLYQDGGNAYYAEQVKLNRSILKVMALIIKN
ncbi:lysozyme family protein [Streptococcus sp. sy004]|uniref:lysozyme family protein n=1 Tax=Streptococcus sp. sy004 TaxID=2600149 RepID=UPI0011B625CE|nr:lysozyme family protein [Streptococcus sp. sy004]TWT12337.1 lysozyme family protein [Streptococcus sp. sy004]